MVKKITFLIVAVGLLVSNASARAEDVYVTANGKRFHTELCPLIKNKGAVKLDRKLAEEKGLTPCQKCFKEELSLGEKETKKIK